MFNKFSIKLLLGAFTFLALVQANASEGTLVRACQSLGKYEGRVVFVNLWQQSDRSMTAVFSQALNTYTQKNQFLTVTNIKPGRTSFNGKYALVDKEGFEFTFDEDDRSASWVSFTIKGQKKHIALSCR
jgi:hypothetical protein